MPLPEAQTLREVLRAQGLDVQERSTASVAQHGLRPAEPLEGETTPGPVSSHAEPGLVVMDLGDPAAAALLQALRPLPGTMPGRRGRERPESSKPTGPVIVAVGSAAVATEIALQPEDAVFDRPLDVDAVLRFVLSTLAPRGTLRPSAPPPAGERHALGTSADRFAEDFDGMAGLSEADLLLGNLAFDELPAGQARAELSADIQQLLESAAARAREERHRPPGTNAEERDPILVPQDVMATLDDLLRSEEDPPHEGSGAEPGSAPSAVVHAMPPPDSTSERGNLPGERASASSSGHGSAPGDRPSASSWPPEPTRAPPSTWPPIPLGALAGMPAPRIETVGARTIPMPDRTPLALQEPARPVGRDAAARAPSSGRAAQPSLSALAASSARLLGEVAPPSAPSVDETPSAPATVQHGPISKPEDTAARSRGPKSSLPPPQTRTDYEIASQSGPELAEILGSEHQPFGALGRAIAARATGGLRFETLPATIEAAPVRWIVLRDGDIVTAASELHHEGLVPFLVGRGELTAEVVELYGSRLPHAGRHAAAALIAHGFLAQDELWPALRAHAEWVITRALADGRAVARLAADLPEQLRAEPNVFGGAAGVEVFIEAVRRVWSPEQATRSLGGAQSSLSPGPNLALLAESALGSRENDAIRGLRGARLGDTLGRMGTELAPVLLALAALGVLECLPPEQPRDGERTPAEAPFDPLDVEAVRARVRARIALVREGDYFSLLGVPPDATEYEIRRAFVGLRRTFEPARLLTAATADLSDDVRLIVEVLEESYEILRDPHRRGRYRRALLGDERRSSPPAKD